VADHDFVWIRGARDWVFMAGVILLLLVALAAMPDKSDRWFTARESKERKEQASAAHGIYLVGLLDLLCIVSFLDFRRGLVAHLGLPEVWSWVLAPIGLVLVLAVSLAAWGASYGWGSDKDPMWRWLVMWALFLAAVFGYITVAVGPSVWFRSS
jgi:hypothetical protein